MCACVCVCVCVVSDRVVTREFAAESIGDMEEWVSRVQACIDRCDTGSEKDQNGNQKKSLTFVNTPPRTEVLDKSKIADAQVTSDSNTETVRYSTLKCLLHSSYFQVFFHTQFVYFVIHFLFICFRFSILHLIYFICTYFRTCTLTSYLFNSNQSVHNLNLTSLKTMQGKKKEKGKRKGTGKGTR